MTVPLVSRLWERLPEGEKRDIEVGEIAEFLHGQVTGSGPGCDPCR